MRRKLSAIEHVIEGNLVFLVNLEGTFTPDQLHSALSRVQRKHPALRALIRQEPDGLYYEPDSAPEIPLRILSRVTKDDYQNECELELTTAFAHNQPQLRAVWLRSELESDLIFTTSHRICDGMSMLTIVREILRSLHSGEELIPYEPITPRDMIGDYQPPQLWKRKLTAGLMNALLRMIPTSRHTPENKEYFLQWDLDQALSDALKQRCKTEGISVHSALVVALDRVLFTVLNKKSPKWIDCPIDARRGRRGHLAALKSDMLFFGGGSLKIRTGLAPEKQFWARAKMMSEEMRKQAKQELLDIPGRYHFYEMLHPLSSGQMQSIVRLGDALKINGSWNRFALSNLGNVVVGDDDAPFRLKDLRLYVHSFNVRVLGLVAYAFNGEMRFYYVGDEKCLSRSQADALKHEFMALLQYQVSQTEDAVSEVRAGSMTVST